MADGVAGGFEHALEAAQQREREDDLAEVSMLEIAPKVLGVPADRPLDDW
jgi:hypothetical protein